MLEVARDITREVQREEERLELARQMQEAQRLESLGVMAGGITHDFNNLLTPILGRRRTRTTRSSLRFADPAADRADPSRRAEGRRTHQTVARLFGSGAGVGRASWRFLDSSKRWASCSRAPSRVRRR